VWSLVFCFFAFRAFVIKQQMASSLEVRQATVSGIRDRITKHISSYLPDTQIVALALAASTRSAQDLVEFLFPREVSTPALANIDDVKISQLEFDRLFGDGAQITRVGEIVKLQKTTAFKVLSDRVQKALRCTTGEDEVATRWQRPLVRAVSLLAVHMGNHDAALSVCLGGVVAADGRRIDDLIESLDADVETMALANTIVAIANAVT